MKITQHWFWRQVAYATVTGLLVANWQHPDAMLILVYLAVVSGSEFARHIIDFKFGGQPPPPPEGK